MTRDELKQVNGNIKLDYFGVYIDIPCLRRYRIKWNVCAKSEDEAINKAKVLTVNKWRLKKADLKVADCTVSEAIRWSIADCIPPGDWSSKQIAIHVYTSMATAAA